MFNPFASLSLRTKLHVIVHSLLVTWQAVAGAAEPPTAASFVVMYNDGGGDAGPWYVTAQKPWPAVFQEFENYSNVMIHNPGGHVGYPMTMTQLSRMTADAKANPTNANYQARADWAAFTTAGKAREKWWAVYIGGSRTLPALPGETARGWERRASLELKPVIDAQPDCIIFDAERGDLGTTVAHGVNGGMHLLIAKLRKLGIEVGIEPTTFEDIPRYHTLSICLLDNYWYSRESKQDWTSGKNAARPLRHVNLHPRVYRIVAGDDLPSEVVAARSAGHVPCIKVLKLPKGIE